MREDITKKHLFGYTFRRTDYNSLKSYREVLLKQMSAAHDVGTKYTSKDGHIFLKSPDSPNFSFFHYGKDYTVYLIRDYECYQVAFHVLKEDGHNPLDFLNGPIPSEQDYYITRKIVLMAEKNCNEIAQELEDKGDHERLHAIKGPIDHYIREMCFL